MAEHFPGYIPEASSEDEANDTPEKKTDKKSEKTKSKSKESKADSSSEKRERSEDIPVEKLADDEKSPIAAELARLRAEQAKQELQAAQENSIERTEAAPVVEFDEALQANLEDGQTFDEALDNAEEAAIELIGVENTEEVVDEDGEPAVEAESVNEPEAVETTEADDDAETTDSSGGSGPGGPGGSGGSGGSSSGNSGGGGSSTSMSTRALYGSPTGHAIQNGPVPGGPGSPGGPGGPTSPNTLAVPMEAPEPERPSVAPYVLAGGLIGYLIGRRRGRIKTEKKLLPVQKKLEKEVGKLEKQIVLREEKIRKLTREQAVKQPDLQSQIAERKQQKQHSGEQTVTQHDRPKLAGEKLGKLAFRSEAVKIEPANTERLKPVEIMTMPELLVIAQKIKLEQSDVKKLYESNRLDDTGLRRVIRAYLRGENYQKTLREYMISPESKQFEADPLQQRASGASSTKQQTTDTTDYNQQVQPNQQQAYSNPPAYQVSPADVLAHDTKANAKTTQQRSILTAVVVILALLIVGFLLFR